MSELLTLSKTTNAEPSALSQARAPVPVEISTPSGFEPIGIVIARIVEKLMANPQQDAA